jgi:zinc D-Ala-D-Ala carboxypeptidase
MRFPALASALALTLSLGGCLPMAIFAQGGYGYQTNFGTYVADREVNAFCLTPKLRFAIWNFEGQFGHKIVLNSGYRDRSHNEATGGKEHSYHMRCMAADFFIPGVPKEQLVAYAQRLDLVGGLGCYPGQPFIHMDVRERPRGARGPVLFSGC